MSRWFLPVALALLLPAVPALAQPSGGDDDLPPMMRNPRQLSGIARPEQNDPPGQLTIRAVLGAMKRTEHGDVVSDIPEGTSIHLIGIDKNGRATVSTAALDAGGRAVFQNLATDGSISYHALALFPRDDLFDRVQSRQPILMPPQVGMRMILAGHAAGSGNPPADDLLGDQLQNPPAAGEIVVEIDGQTEGIQEIELYLVKPVAKRSSGTPAGDRTDSDTPVARARAEHATTVLRPQGRVRDPAPDPALRDGLIAVSVKRRGQGVPALAIELAAAPAEPAAADPAPGPSDIAPVAATTDAEGRALFEAAQPGVKYLLRASVHGRVLESSALFELPVKGGLRVDIDVEWQEVQSLRARFTGVEDGGGAIYLARAPRGKRLHLSPPFQLTSARGAVTQILVFDNLFLGFHGGSGMDDDKLWFEIRFSIINPSLVPFDPGPAGLRLPLPRNFRGASVSDEMAARVKVDETSGLVWRGLIPPGQRDFTAGFYLPVDDGAVTFDLDLPHGALESQLVLPSLPGMRLEPPEGVQQRMHKGQDGRAMVILGGIDKRPGQPLRFRVAGLPQPPAWKRWLRNGAGIAVIGLFCWGIAGVAMRLRSGLPRADQLATRREELLEALVLLEADHRGQKIGGAVFKKKRAALTRELEGIYAEERRWVPDPAAAKEEGQAEADDRAEPDARRS